jgi:hypothetical protein
MPIAASRVGLQRSVICSPTVEQIVGLIEVFTASFIPTRPTETYPSPTRQSDTDPG